MIFGVRPCSLVQTTSVSSEQPALIQIGDQPVPSLVQARAKLLLHAGIVVVVRVPAAAGQAVFVPKHADDAAAGFDQPPRGQARLSEQRVAVQFAHAGVFFAQIERVAQLVRLEQLVGHLPIAIHLPAART